MPLYETTMESLIERLCRTVLNDWKTGTATGGSTTTVVDAVRRDEPDDYFQNTIPVSYAYIRTTTDNLAPKGEERKASDFANTGGSLTVTPAFSVTTGAGDTYAIIHLKRWDELKEYLNSAIDLVKSEVLLPKIDETSITIQPDTYEYPLPSGFTHIYRVTQADANGDFYDAPIDPTHYTIVRAATTPMLHFKKAPAELALADHFYGMLWYDAESTDDRKLRVEGMGLQSRLVGDQDICYINPSFVVAQAGAFVHASLSRRSDNEPDDHATQFKIWQSIADNIRGNAGFRVPLPPNTKRVR
jgi:hypothetical protein